MRTRQTQSLANLVHEGKMSASKYNTRREFLKKAGAIGLPLLVPAPVLGRAGRKPPSDRIVMGCIGLGGQGTYNMKAFLSQNDVEVVALCDVNRGSDDYDMLYQFNGNSAGLAPAVQRWRDFNADRRRSGRSGDPATYHDFRELLQHPDLDAVTVCTPDHWHGLVSIAAAEAGLDVYCEKPLTNTVAEGRALCEAVQRKGRVLQTGSHERSNHSVRFAVELIRNNRIGKLHTIRVNMPVDSHGPIEPQAVMSVPDGFDYDMWLGPTPWVPYTKKRTHFWWRFILAYGGGEMTDRGAHIIDLAQLALDADSSGPVEIAASGWAPRDGLFDTFMKFDFTCTYGNGVRMIGSSDTPRGIRLEGSRGWIFIHIHGGRLEADPPSLLREVIGPEEYHLGRTPGHHRNFLDAVRSRGIPFAPAEVGHRTATICHLLNIAMQTGRTLHWDPHRETITNDPEAQRMLKRPMRPPWHL